MSVVAMGLTFLAFVGGGSDSAKEGSFLCYRCESCMHALVASVYHPSLWTELCCVNVKSCG